jgi:hypothetical protein
MLRTPAATLPPPKTKPWKQTHEPVRRHHRLIDRREERTRDLYDPRDLVTPHFHFWCWRISFPISTA